VGRSAERKVGRGETPVLYRTGLVVGSQRWCGFQTCAQRGDTSVSYRPVYCAWSFIFRARVVSFDRQSHLHPRCRYNVVQIQRTQELERKALGMDLYASDPFGLPLGYTAHEPLYAIYHPARPARAYPDPSAHCPSYHLVQYRPQIRPPRPYTAVQQCRLVRFLHESVGRFGGCVAIWDVCGVVQVECETEVWLDSSGCVGVGYEVGEKRIQVGESRWMSDRSGVNSPLSLTVHTSVRVRQFVRPCLTSSTRPRATPSPKETAISDEAGRPTS
jgi:hypothetical protein